MNNQDSQQTTRKMAKVKVEFRIHLINYIAVNTLLAIINLTLTPGYIWFKWPLLGWGIGVIFHALSANSSGKSMNERMIEVEMRKINDETFKKRR